MKEVFVWIDEIQLRDYLKYFGKGPLTQDDDFIAAIWMKKFYELKLNKPFSIGFKMTASRKKDLPDWNTATLGDLHNALRKMRRQDDPIDFALSEGRVLNIRGKAFAFQVKRFVGNSVTDTTAALIDYLNNIWKKYGESRLKLGLLIMMGNVSFSLKEVYKRIDYSKAPFSPIYFVGVKFPNMYFGELYPKVWSEIIPAEKLT